MNTPDSARHPLLRELLENERGACGPSAEQVSRLVRGVHARRTRRRGMALGAAALTVLASFAAIHLRTPHAPAVAAIPPASPPIVNAGDAAPARESFVVETIDDAGLLEMLKDQPVALASLPNGERLLMMLLPAPRMAAATDRPRK